MPVKSSVFDNLFKLQKGKQFLERHTDPEKIKQFKFDNDMWRGQIGDLSLHNFYIQISI